MLGIGIIEGFFGPEWSWSQRHQWSDLLQAEGGDFYIYAPKRDSYLRKNWMQDHPAEIWTELKALGVRFRANKIKFGVGLSPFELHEHWGQRSKDILKKKIQKLEEIDIQLLGLFFDDMRGCPDLAEKQIEIIEFVKSVTETDLLFCPTYYSHDPILDKVFGSRPEKYLEKVGEGVAQDVSILWTGNKVISPAISSADLAPVAEILKRKPVIWDNYFANDGPRQCKFLPVKPFEGRDRDAFNGSSGWAFNLMNESSLSMVVYLASLAVLRGTARPRHSLQAVLERRAGPEWARFLEQHENTFTKVGLDGLDESFRQEVQKILTSDNVIAQEIGDWLNGKYLVGPECLTD